MSHQDDFPRNPMLDKLLREVRGEYPDGRLNAHDEGAQLLSITSVNGKIVMEFPTPTKWIGFTADDAVALANLLIEHARKIGSTKPLTVKI